MKSETKQGKVYWVLFFAVAAFSCWMSYRWTPAAAFFCFILFTVVALYIWDLQRQAETLSGVSPGAKRVFGILQDRGTLSVAQICCEALSSGPDQVLECLEELRHIGLADQFPDPGKEEFQKENPFSMPWRLTFGAAE